MESQLRSNYPLVIFERINDPIQNQILEVKELTLKKGNYYPIATYANFQDIDPLSSILSILSKGNPDEVTMIQFALEAIGASWQNSGQRLAETGGVKTKREYF